MNPMEHFKETCSALHRAATAYGQQKNSPNWDALCASAETFAKARWAIKTPPKTASSRSAFVMPFGKMKGTPLAECDVRDLKFLIKVLPENIADPTKSRWSGQNQELLDAAEAELATR